MVDFITSNWWVVTASGTNNWSIDYTRYRSGVSTSYTSPDDLIGSNKSGKYIDNTILNPPQ